jgi:hypothetical protein
MIFTIASTAARILVELRHGNITGQTSLAAPSNITFVEREGTKTVICRGNRFNILASNATQGMIVLIILIDGPNEHAPQAVLVGQVDLGLE